MDRIGSVICQIFARQIFGLPMAVTPVSSETKGSNVELWTLGSLSKQTTAKLEKLG